MRTAVVRVNVDPAGELDATRVRGGVAAVTAWALEHDGAVIDNKLESMPANRRELHLLLAGDDREALMAAVLQACRAGFGAEPAAGVITFVSRGTDDDAHGVLAGFKLTGQITRLPGDDGLDIVQVTLARADLARVPESRIHTALEASLNCEVRIVTV